MRLEDIIAPEQDPAGQLAQMVADLKYDDIPAEHVDYVKKDILDMMGCMISGTTEHIAAIAAEQAREWGGCGNGKILVFGDQVPVPFAAFANGTMARARDMGDTHNEGGHIGEWVVPALMSGLGLCTEKVSGKDFITAFVAGAEWGAREHITIRLQRDTTTTPGECAGPRYSVGALSKLLGFSKEQIWTAQGMAYSTRPQAEQQKYNEGTAMVRLQHGYVCADAIKSVSLVHKSDEVTAPKSIYMGIGGLLKNVKREVLSPDTLSEDLGKRWMWRENITMKPYAGCKFNHTEIYGLLNLMKEHGFTWHDIKRMHFTISNGCRIVYEPAEAKWNPDSAAAAMFSAPYSIAFAAMTGDCFLEAYQEDTVKQMMENPNFTDLMGRITIEVDPTLPPFDNYTVCVTLKNGETYQKVEENLLGNVVNPMTWEQVEHKFRNCTRFSAVDLGEEKYQKVIDICKNLENIEDVRELVEAMTP